MGKGIKVSTTYPTGIVRVMDDVVKRGLFPSRSEFVRYCVMTTIQSYFTPEELNEEEMRVKIEVGIKRFFRQVMQDSKTITEFYKLLGVNPP